MSDAGLAYAPTATEVAIHTAPAESVRTPLAVASAKLRAARASVVRGRLHVGDRAAHDKTLAALGIKGLTREEVVRLRESLGLREIDRRIDRPLMLTTGQIVESGFFVTDRVNGHRERAHVIYPETAYPRVPKKADSLPPWHRDLFEDRDSALNFVAVHHALAARRAVSGLGLIAVHAASETSARILVDVMTVLATGAEAPTPSVLGEPDPRDFLSGSSGTLEEEDDDDDDDDGDGDGDDEAEAEAPPSDIDEGLHSEDDVLVIYDSKEVVQADPTRPIFYLNPSPDAFASSTRVRRIRLRKDVTLRAAAVELAEAGHRRQYAQALARVREAGAPLSFDKLLTFLSARIT